MYLSPGTWVRFPRKAKTPIVKGVGEDREVAVPGTPKARAVTLFGRGILACNRCSFMLALVCNFDCKI
jgi:hypothetical protein